MSVGIFDLLTGALLVEFVFRGWTKVPFACLNAPAAETIKSRWLLFLVGLNVFAFRGADLQLLALGSSRATLVYIVAAVGAIVVTRAASLRRARRLTVTFDDPTESGSVALNLSEALN